MKRWKIKLGIDKNGNGNGKSQNASFDDNNDDYGGGSDYDEYNI